MEWTDTAFICMCISCACLAVALLLKGRTIKELREELEELRREGEKNVAD